MATRIKVAPLVGIDDIDAGVPDGIDILSEHRITGGALAQFASPVGEGSSAAGGADADGASGERPFEAAARLLHQAEEAALFWRETAWDDDRAAETMDFTFIDLVGLTTEEAGKFIDTHPEFESVALVGLDEDASRKAFEAARPNPEDLAEAELSAELSRIREAHSTVVHGLMSPTKTTRRRLRSGEAVAAIGELLSAAEAGIRGRRPLPGDKGMNDMFGFNAEEQDQIDRKKVTRDAEIQRMRSFHDLVVGALEGAEKAIGR